METQRTPQRGLESHFVGQGRDPSRRRGQGLKTRPTRDRRKVPRSQAVDAIKPREFGLRCGGQALRSQMLGKQFLGLSGF